MAEIRKDDDLERLRNLLKEGYRIVGTRMTIKPKLEKEEAEVTLKKDQIELTVKSSQKEFFWHVVHLYSIPHVEDEDSDFMYIDDTNKYWKLQEEIVNLFTGKLDRYTINSVDLPEAVVTRLKKAEKDWVMAEKNINIGNTRLCQIFYDILIIFLKGERTSVRILTKERTTLSDINAVLLDSQKADYAVCYSAFIVGPEISSKKKNGSEVIIGILAYDIKSRKTLSLNLNSVGQFQRKSIKIGQNGFWECVYDLLNRTESGKTFTSYLPLPLNLRDYTPLPWFCIAFLKGIKNDVTIANTVELDLPLFLAFGTPLLRESKPSYSFNAEKQSAIIMLGFRENGKGALHQVRFDMSKGERSLHIDYQVFPEEGFCYKIVGHSVINYKEIWEFSENLAVGFLLAAAYDINFEKLVIPKGLNGIDDAFKENPLTVYPLFVRSMAGRPYRLVKEDPKLSEALMKIGKEVINDQEAIKNLEDLGLIKNTTKTVLGDIVYARLLQTQGK